ncbi:hypothetical protein ACS5PN_09375 [Roseateles sp. NT4]|uniref:hypothetical protein n=1 Tax=Roseateles sp. NT4 TaxID=3453715 RepID=UPI003EF02491
MILALFASVFGLVMVTPPKGSDHSWGAYLFGAFCFAIALVCVLKGRAAQIVGAFIALCIACAGLANLGSALMDAPFFMGRRSDVSVLNALLFCGVFGVPAAMYLWATRFGFAAPAKPISEQLAVEFDESGAATKVLDGLEERWNQRFFWPDVERVCFKDEGLANSDLILISLRSTETRVIVPTEARGGVQFIGELAARDLFPEHVWRQAVAETGGGTHCWPPHEKA